MTDQQLAALIESYQKSLAPQPLSPLAILAYEQVRLCLLAERERWGYPVEGSIEIAQLALKLYKKRA
jgi:hypothetical protein